MNDRDDSLLPAERTIVADCIRYHHRERYDLGIFVVMDDHVHVLVQMRPGIDLGEALKSWKGISSRRINRLRSTAGTLWEKDTHTELLGTQIAIDSRRQYIWNNPRQRWGIEPHTYELLENFD